MIYNSISGSIRILIFLSYLYLISKTKEASRLFQYHGAEHKVVYTFENGDDLTVQNSNQSPTQHPRCGTSFNSGRGICCEDRGVVPSDRCN